MGWSDRFKDMLEALQAELRRHGIHEFRIEHGGKHPRLLYMAEGREEVVIVAGSSSDHRAIANAVSHLRRRLRGAVPAEAAPFEPPPEPPPVAALPEDLVVTRPTAKDLKVLEALDRDSFLAADEIGRRAGAANPALWAARRLARLEVLGLAVRDAAGRWRRGPAAPH